jgi:hypothetical protein
VSSNLTLSVLEATLLVKEMIAELSKLSADSEVLVGIGNTMPEVRLTKLFKLNELRSVRSISSGVAEGTVVVNLVGTGV